MYRKNQSKKKRKSKIKYGKYKRGGSRNKTRKGNKIFNKAYSLSHSLRKVCNGKQSLSRPQVVSHVWKYIKNKKLQSNRNRRVILCDNNMKGIMGGKNQVDMFTMNKHISKHLH